MCTMVHMTNVAFDHQQHLRPLPDEPWGDKLRRARESSPDGKLTLQAAAHWIEIATARTLNHTTIGRLESLIGPPKDAPRRRLAYLLTMRYQLDPAELGLVEDGDAPDDVTLARLRAVVRSR